MTIHVHKNYCLPKRVDWINQVKSHLFENFILTFIGLVDAICVLYVLYAVFFQSIMYA